MQHFEPQTEFFVELPAPASLQGPSVERAREQMRRQIAGEKVNHSESRAVGHEWLRRPELAPSREIREAIVASHQQILEFRSFPQEQILLLGIGGSALGVQMLAQALAPDPRRLHCIDNADPQGIREALARIDPRVTTPIVVTKSGNSAETVTAWRCAQAHWERQGQNWESKAMAVTGPGSQLHQVAQDWRACLPIWPWVGGRFCVSSPAGLLPLHLLGVDIQALLAGAASMDAWTGPDQEHNPALALAKHLYDQQSQGKLHSLAIMAYRDRLQLLGRYLQQLVMESLGKALDLEGERVHQGLSLFGERGSCDQHSILQYLSQGRADTQTILIESRQDDHQRAQQSELSTQHLSRLLGSYESLRLAQRPALLLSLADLNAQSLGATVAFFERWVGYYAGIAKLNAYDQPGVEAGKKASIALVQAHAAMPQLLREGWISASELAQRSELPLAVAWRLAMQWVQQGQAEWQKAEKPDQQQFRWRES